MSEIITEISIYLILAILLGYIFGWLIAKARTKEQTEQQSHKINEEEFDTLNQERLQYQVENSELLSENNKTLLENREQKLKIHQLVRKLQERDLLLKSKNKQLEELSTKMLKEEKKHELEMLAFIEEREEMIQKWQPSKN